MLLQPVPSLCGVEDPLFARAMGSLLGPPLTGGNLVQTLVNGDAFFPAMLGAIASARRTITLETYMMWSGDIAGRFVAALTERARNGVAVHVTLDWFGSRRLGPSFRQRLLDAGVQLVSYRPPGWRLVRLQHRTHRRILVVDGRVGFTGGMGIADAWAGDARRGRWRDTAIRVEGPAVASLQAAFVDNWVEATGRVLHGEGYFPPLQKRGNTVAQAFWSSPHEGNYAARVMYHLSIASAKREIRIANAYFIPDRLLLRALCEAVARGVTVKVLVAGLTDITLTRWASHLRWSKLLESGVRIFEYRRAPLHAKTMIVDDTFVTIGSINADSLSLWLLDEVSLNVLDREVAAENVAIFERDLEDAGEVTLEHWRKRSWWHRVRERLAGLLAPRM